MGRDTKKQAQACMCVFTIHKQSMSAGQTFTICLIPLSNLFCSMMNPSDALFLLQTCKFNQLSGSLNYWGYEIMKPSFIYWIEFYKDIKKRSHVRHGVIITGLD